MHCGRVFYISSLFLNSLHDIQDIFDQSTLLVSILFVQIKLSSVSVGLFRIKENPHFFQILLQFLTMSSLSLFLFSLSSLLRTLLNFHILELQHFCTLSELFEQKEL
jgi:hypothetical protein